MVLSVILCLASGCAGDAVDPALTPASEATEDAIVLGTFFGQYDAQTNQFSIVPIEPGTEELIPKRFDGLVIDRNGVANNTNTPGASVEFQTNSFSTPPGDATYPLPNFTANLSIRSFYQRPLDNVYAEVVSLRPAAGGTMTACTTAPCTAISQIPAPLTGYLDPANLSKGIWQYGNIAADGNKNITWTWLGSSNFNFVVQVKGSPARLSYAQGRTDNVPFVDACLIPGATAFSLSDDGTTPAIVLPFPFTIFDKTSSTIAGSVFQLRIAANGYLNIGTSITTTALNAPLPTLTGARSGIFAFWDDLVPTAGGVCYAVQGTWPTRSAIVTWKNANVKSIAGSTITFSAVLYEQTDVIDFLYDAPYSGNPDDPEAYEPELVGGSATFGLQNFARNAASFLSSDAEQLSYDPSLYPQRIRFTPGN
jgi:hypothetical protein